MVQVREIRRFDSSFLTIHSSSFASPLEGTMAVTINNLPPELKLVIAQRIADSDADCRSLKESFNGATPTWSGRMGRSMQAMVRVNREWRTLISPHLFRVRYFQVFVSIDLFRLMSLHCQIVECSIRNRQSHVSPRHLGARGVPQYTIDRPNFSQLGTSCSHQSSSQASPNRPSQ